MALPASFLRDGFVMPSQARKRHKLPNGALLKPLMIGTEGVSNSGKSEFILSCPGPGIAICIDRGMEPVFDNPRPPKARRDDFAVKYMTVPLLGQTLQPEYLEYFKQCRSAIYTAIANPDALTIAIDGDSDFWELQVLAEFGKKTQVWPQTRWGDVQAARRVITARCHDSGKIIIGTNKLKDEYEPVIGDDGLPVKENNGEIKRAKTGRLERQGFKDQDYLWNIQIRHLYQPPRVNAKTNKEMPAQWGLRILKCKADTSLEGTELWAGDCNFAGLVHLVYPNVTDKEWGL